MDYERLCDYYDRLASTRARLVLTDVLVELVKEAGEDDIAKIVYLTQGKLYPDFVGIELGMAEKLVLRALSFATGYPEEKVLKEYRDAGDVGDAAEALFLAAKGGDSTSRKKGAKGARQMTLAGLGGDEDEEAEKRKAADAGPVTAAGVYQIFEEIAKSTGAGSQDQKLSKLETLLLRASPRAAKYLTRSVTGKLRLGIADMTLLDALASAFATKEDRARLERAYNVSSDLGLVAQTVKRGGLAALDGIRLKPGVPVRAMLAERLPTAEEILEKLGGKCAVELKYDGLRLQAHRLPSGEIRFYSRRLEDLTAQFPDVAQGLRESIGGEGSSTFILEGEVVAVDPDSGEMRPFQDTSLRRRKHGIDAAVRDIPVTLFAFDLLLLDGEDLTERPFPERRALLERRFAASERLQHSRLRYVDDTQDLLAFFDEAVGEMGEGIMCKSVAPDSTYRAGSRGWQWIKFKREYKSDLADSLDLVVVGAFAGRGRRKGWYGALLMAAYNAEEDVFETTCKLGTGFDDATLASMTEKFRETLVDARPPRVRSQMEADYWFEPRHVAEVVGAELTLSPIHPAAAGEVREGSGLAVRFPRFKQWRSDKAAEEATSTRELVSMYKARQREAAPAADEG